MIVHENTFVWESSLRSDAQLTRDERVVTHGVHALILGRAITGIPVFSS
jgi:hypothetical protein